MNGPFLQLWQIKALGVGLVVVAVAILAYGITGNRESALYRLWARYVSHLENRLRCMFIRDFGARIAIAQLSMVGVVIAIALLTGESSCYLNLLPVVWAPNAIIERLLRRRSREIERKLDAFITTFVNALKATPSIGNALAYTQPLIGAPLDDELALVLKEIKVGTSLDQALLNMSTRIQSADLDAMLASILIGRQVGGNLPSVLERTGETLREMSRLRGVVRTKTAEGKVQLFVVALAPIVLVGGFHLLNPHYFDPLLGSAFGAFLILMCVVLWCLALLMARRIIAVNV